MLIKDHAFLLRVKKFHKNYEFYKVQEYLLQI